MAAITSAQSGNWSAGATWTGGVKPGAGDTAVIATGHTVTVDENTTVGATTGTAHGVFVSGSSSSSYGALIVPDGVTLTLTGVSTTYFALYCQRYGRFTLQPGAKVVVACTSDYQTGIKIDGIIDARGTAEKPIVFTVPNLPSSWSGYTTDITGETKSGSGYLYYGNISVRALTNQWIANAGKTALGVSGASTSFAVTTSTPAGLATIPVNSIEAVDGAGKYYLDHHTGILYFWNTAVNPSLTYNYSYLTRTAAAWRGWGLWVANNSTYNEGMFDHCVFEYMGGVAASLSTTSVSATDTVLHFGYKQSPSVATDRNAYVKNSVFRFNSGASVTLQDCIGASGDPILITGNTFNDTMSGSRALTNITIRGTTTAGAPNINNYIEVSSNEFNTRAGVLSVQGGATNLQIKNNTGYMGMGLFTKLNPSFSGAASFGNDIYPASVDTGGLLISGNDLKGRGASLDARTLEGVAGSSTSPAIVENNHFRFGNRFGSQIGSYATYRKNKFGDYYHHGMTASIINDRYVTDVLWENNLFYGLTDSGGSLYGDAWISTGYNHPTVINNLKIVNNTVDGGRALLSLGDPQDGDSYSLATNLVAVNNIVYRTTRAIERDPDDATAVNRIQPIEIDYWLTNGLYSSFGANTTNTTNLPQFWSGSNKYNRSTRNVPFAYLYDASYTTAQVGRDLVHTANTIGQNHTLTWGSGAPVQLINDYGTAAGQSRRTVTCIGKTWVTNNIRSRWLYTMSGTGAGQARAITNSAAYGMYAATIVNGGSSYSVGQYVSLNGGTSTYAAIIRVTQVSGGAVTAFEIISGGLYTVAPADAVATTRGTGAAGAGLTLNCLWGPTLLLSHDLDAPIANDTVFAIVESEVTLSDGAGGTVRAGIYGPDFITTGGSDTNITMTVNKSVSADPLFVDGYKLSAGSPAIDSGTADNAATTDYYGTVRSGTVDIGFFEYVATGDPQTITFGGLTLSLQLTI